MTSPGGYWSRSRNGPTLLVRIIAGTLLIAFLGVSAWLSLWDSPSLGLNLANIVALWVAVVLLSWSSLRDRVNLGHAAMGVGCLLMSVEGLLFGVELMRDGDQTLGVGALVGALMVCVWLLLIGVGFLGGGESLFGVGTLLLGFGFLLFGVEVVRVGELLFGVGFLLVGAGSLVFSVGKLMGGTHTNYVGLLLVVVGTLLPGAEFLLGSTDEGLLFGIWALLTSLGPLLIGIGLLLFVVGTLLDVTDESLLFGVVALLVGVGTILIGIGLLAIGLWQLLKEGNLLLGFMFLLSGGSGVVGGAAWTVRVRMGSADRVRTVSARVWERLNRRDDRSGD